MSRKKNRDTTFRFPFDIDTRYFLVFAFVFFIFSIKPVNNFLFSNHTPIKLKNKIEKDVEWKIKEFNRLLQDTFLANNTFSQHLRKEQLSVLNAQDYALFFFQNHELKYWNDVHTICPLDTFAENKPVPYKDHNGYYIALQKSYSSHDRNQKVVALFKIKHDNGINNNYFTKSFVVGDHQNDYNLELAFEKVANSRPIIVNGETQFYIYKNDDFLAVNDRNGWRLFLSAVPFILFGVSIHTYFKVEIKKRNIQLIFSLLLLTVLIIRGASYAFGFPNDFEQFSIFSPEYFASDMINKSLGDVFINMCLLFWILLFYIINVQGKVFILKNNKFKEVISISVFLISIASSLYLSNLVYRITRDSVINFDTTLFYKLDLFSFMGILTYMVIHVNIFCIAILCYNNLAQSFNNKYFKYILFLIAYLLFVLSGFEFDDGIYYYFIFIYLALLFLLQDLKYLKIKFDFNSYKLLILMIFISVSGSFFLTLLTAKKEISDRSGLAQRLLDIADRYSAETLEEKLQKIEKDEDLKSILSIQTYHENDLAEYLQEKYFDVDGKECRLSFKLLSDSDLQKRSIVTSMDTSQKMITISREEKFMAKLYPLIDLGQGKKVRLEIILNKKNSTHTNQYFDLLLNSFDANLLMNNLYSYAIYKNSVIAEQKGGHEFPYHISFDSTFYNQENQSIIFRSDHSELWVRNEKGNYQVCMAKDNNNMFLFTTLFAYIFFIYFVVISLYILGNIIARSNLQYKRFINLLSINLRLRIHFAILAVELFSFIVIGYFTSFFLIDRVHQKMKLDLSKYSITVQREVRNNSQDLSAPGMNLLSNYLSEDYLELMQEISDRFRINLNVFSIEQGKLLFSTIPEIFQKGVLLDRVDPEIFQKFLNGNNNDVIKEENLGLLKFLSSYFLIRDAGGHQIGVVQIPFFLSSSEVSTETTTIVITLINIYIFVFLISSIIAYFLTKSVTRPFTYIVKQFTKINLSKTNEPLKWFDSDEIGMLIKEYNRMLRKLENSTVLLAKREREDAWREMAKQVAHEIKNPLTPMKLSLQMLERAIKNNASNVNEISIKVTKTLVEQIDNLSIIASNFSDFAKLPVSKNEIFRLNELLYSVTGMYHDDTINEFLFMIPDYEIQLYADKSQIMRVFTNIIQNAIQSIPEDRKGNIALTVSKIKNNFVRISISDNGEGISDEKAKNLFQPYFTTKTSGTGLGLAMCKDIIEDSGGKISFDSIMNEGSIFHIDLPIHLLE